MLFCTTLLLLATFCRGLLEANKPDVDSDNSDNTLYLVHILFRHGERTPQSSYPKDIHINETYYPHGYGELRNKGKLRMYDIGLSLRKRYEHFLSEIYNQSEVSALSSPYSRTRMSCELVMAALFQPNCAERWHPYLNWQPTICDYEPVKGNLMFLAERNCGKATALKQAEIQKDKANGKFEKYEHLFNYLNQHSGLKMETPADVTKLFDILRCQNEMDMRLPKWAHNVFPSPMSNISVMDWDYIAKSDDLKRYNGGVLFKKIMNDTKNKMNSVAGYEDKKLFIYSGHDSNIVPLLEILNIYERQIMPYGATLILEMHRIKKEVFVKVFFQSESSWKPKLMHLPDCRDGCKLEKFEKIYQKYYGSHDMCL